MARRHPPGTDGEPRGAGARFAGLCDQCGTATVRVADDGKARHAGCDIAGHQVTVDEAIATVVKAGLVPDPADDW